MLAINGRKALRVSEVAEALGLSTKTVRRMISDRSLRAVRVGRSVLVPADEIDRLLSTTAPAA